MSNLPDEYCLDDCGEENFEKQYYIARFKESDEFIINDANCFDAFYDFIDEPEEIGEVAVCKLLGVSNPEEISTALNFYPGLLIRACPDEWVHMLYVKDLYKIEEVDIDGNWLECIRGDVLFSLEGKTYYVSPHSCRVYSFLYFKNDMMDIFSPLLNEYSRNSSYKYAIFLLDEDMTNAVESITKKNETGFMHYINNIIENNPEKLCTVEDYCQAVEDYACTLKKYTPLQKYYLDTITSYKRSGHYKNPFSMIGINSLGRIVDHMESQYTQEHVSIMIASEALSCVLQKKYSIQKIRNMAKKGELSSILSDKIYIELDSLFNYILEHSGIRIITAGQLATYMSNAQKESGKRTDSNQ